MDTFNVVLAAAAIGAIWLFGFDLKWAIFAALIYGGIYLIEYLNSKH